MNDIYSRVISDYWQIGIRYWPACPEWKSIILTSRWKSFKGYFFRIFELYYLFFGFFLPSLSHRKSQNYSEFLSSFFFLISYFVLHTFPRFSNFNRRWLDMQRTTLHVPSSRKIKTRFKNTETRYAHFKSSHCVYNYDCNGLTQVVMNCDLAWIDTPYLPFPQLFHF